MNSILTNRHTAVTAQSVATTLAKLPERGAEAHRPRALAQALADSGVRKVSGHAVQRAEELGYDLVEVLAAVRCPDTTHDTHQSGRRAHYRDDVCVITADCATVVVTVLLRNQHAWAHGVDTRYTIPAPRQGRQLAG